MPKYISELIDVTWPTTYRLKVKKSDLSDFPGDESLRPKGIGNR